MSWSLDFYRHLPCQRRVHRVVVGGEGGVVKTLRRSNSLFHSNFSAVVSFGFACFPKNRVMSRGPKMRDCLRLKIAGEWRLFRERHGGVEKRGGWKTSRLTRLPKSGFGPPSYGTFSTPLRGQYSVFFLYKKNHDRADQKLFWRGPEISGRTRSLVRFPPPIRFAPGQCTPPLSRPRLSLRLIPVVFVIAVVSVISANPTLNSMFVAV